MREAFSEFLTRHGGAFVLRFAAFAGLLVSLSAGALRAETSEGAGVWYSSGAWGELRHHEVPVAPPATQLWNELYDERSVWRFAGRTREEALSILSEIGFAPELVGIIASQAEWSDSPLGIQVVLQDSIIEVLTPEHRSALFDWWMENDSRFVIDIVYTIEGGEIDYLREQFPPDLIELLDATCFRRGQVLRTFDVPYLLRKIGPDPEAKELLIRLLFSSHSQLVQLRIDPGCDIDALVRYWTAGGLNPGAESILRGVYASGQSTWLDIVQLLPPLPRKYLFEFTHMSDANSIHLPDCFWTSVQFFRANASPRSLDGLPLEHFMNDDFTVVTGPPQFGDVVCLFRERDRSFTHSYVYIADDIAYTKNGSSGARPWILTSRKRMDSIYADDSGFITETYRRKPGD